MITAYTLWEEADTFILLEGLSVFVNAKSFESELLLVQSSPGHSLAFSQHSLLPVLISRKWPHYPLPLFPLDDLVLF